MKKLLFICGLLWSVFASAQFAPFVPGQILTAAELNSAFGLYAPLAGAAFTGPVSLPAGSSVSGYLTTASAVSIYAPLASPVFTGSPTVPGYLTTSSAASTYAPIASPTFTGTVTIPTGAVISGYLTSATAASTYAPLASPTFTGTPVVPGYLTTATASTTYAPLASPTFTGTPSAPTTATANNSTQLATTAFVNNLFSTPPAVGNVTPNNGTFAVLTATNNFIPSQTNGIVGTTTNNNANAGSVGEYVSNTTSGTALTTGIAVNATSVSLTAGDWDVTGVANFSFGASSVVTALNVGISTTSATFSGLGTFTTFSIQQPATGQGETFSTPPVRVSLSSTTTVYVPAFANFTVSTGSVSGFIRARRVR
jgi:hypothetical protein